MSLARRHLSRHTTTISFDPQALAEGIRGECPEVVFALLMGSARDGRVELGSDVDLAVYADQPPNLDLHGRLVETVEAVAPGAHCDVGWLKRAEPVYRFESLRGRLLFTRNREAYLRFFSLTCREYEDQLADYERQHHHRTGST